jgi:hypothetical protein
VPTGCAGKVKEAGERLRICTARPVPVRARVCVAGLAPSVIVKVPVSEPTTVGAKVTFRKQLAPTPTVAPQLSVWAKLLPFVPAMVTFVKLSVALPVFDNVIVCARGVVHLVAKREAC